MSIQLHKMKLNDSPYKLINLKIKKVEMRLNDEKRQLINIGDLIEFTNVDTNEKLAVEVINLHKFSNFKTLYEEFEKKENGFQMIGYLKDEIVDYKDMGNYYNQDDIQKYGVVGIEIKLLEGVNKIKYLNRLSKENMVKRVQNTDSILNSILDEKGKD